MLPIWYLVAVTAAEGRLAPFRWRANTCLVFIRAGTSNCRLGRRARGRRAHLEFVGVVAFHVRQEDVAGGVPKNEFISSENAFKFCQDNTCVSCGELLVA